MNTLPAARFAEHADAGLIARMLHDFQLEFGEPSPGPEVLEMRVGAFIEDRRMTYLLGGPGPDGFAQISFRPTVWDDDPVGYIEELYVKPDRRGHGTGLAIMKAILDEARSRECGSVEVCTGEDDLEARALYEKVGFENEIEGEDKARALYYELNL
ncbi:MAG: GNAT family N-acetyltransferase [Solirubrobacterales bacterium]|nr:GNAT family N-acetyltransferase [Solirubrobacterales bacterium]